MARFPVITIAGEEDTSSESIIMDGVSVIGIYIPTALPAGATHLIFLAGHSSDVSVANPLLSGGVRCSAGLVAGSYLDLTEEVPEIFSCKHIWLQLSDPLFQVITPDENVSFTTTIKDRVGRVVAE